MPGEVGIRQRPKGLGVVAVAQVLDVVDAIHAVDVGDRILVDAVGVDVVRFRDPVGPEGVLDAEEVVLGVGHLQVRVGSADAVVVSVAAARIERRQGADQSGRKRAVIREHRVLAKRECRWLRRTRGVNAGGEVGVDRRIAGLRIAPVGVAAAIEEDARAAANRPVLQSERLPGKAEAGCEVGLLVVDEGTAIGGVGIQTNRDAFDLLQQGHIALGHSQCRQRSVSFATGLRLRPSAIRGSESGPA